MCAFQFSRVKIDLSDVHYQAIANILHWTHSYVTPHKPLICFFSMFVEQSIYSNSPNLQLTYEVTISRSRVTVSNQRCSVDFLVFTFFLTKQTPTFLVPKDNPIVTHKFWNIFRHPVFSAHYSKWLLSWWFGGTDVLMRLSAKISLQNILIFLHYWCNHWTGLLSWWWLLSGGIIWNGLEACGQPVTVDSQLLRKKKWSKSRRACIHECAFACLSLCLIALKRISLNSGNGKYEEEWTTQ